MIGSTGLTLIFFNTKHHTSDRVAAQSVTPKQFRQVEHKKRIQINNNSDTSTSGNADIETSPSFSHCLDDCLDGLFSALFTGKNLSDDEVTSLTSDIENLRHYLNYNPQVIEEIGAIILRAEGNKPGESSYDEALDSRSIILEDVILLIPPSNLARISATMVASQDIEKRSTGLLFIEKAYEVINDKQRHMDMELTAEEIRATTILADTLHNIAYSEDDSEKQLSAIEILISENRQVASPQLATILSQITVNHLDPALRGKAMRLAATIAKPDSPVLTQISDAISNPSSELHLAAIDALHSSLSHLTAKDVKMKSRLDEFKPYLEDFVDSHAPNSQAKVTAQNILKQYYK